MRAKEKPGKSRYCAPNRRRGSLHSARKDAILGKGVCVLSITWSKDANYDVVARNDVVARKMLKRGKTTK